MNVPIPTPVIIPNTFPICSIGRKGKKKVRGEGRRRRGRKEGDDRQSSKAESSPSSLFELSTMTLDERHPFLIGSQSIVRHSYIILSSCRELIFLHAWADGRDQIESKGCARDQRVSVRSGFGGSAASGVSGWSVINMPGGEGGCKADKDDVLVFVELGLTVPEAQEILTSLSSTAPSQGRKFLLSFLPPFHSLAESLSPLHSPCLPPPLKFLLDLRLSTSLSPSLPPDHLHPLKLSRFPPPPFPWTPTRNDRRDSGRTRSRKDFGAHRTGYGCEESGGGTEGEGRRRRRRRRGGLDRW